MIDKNGDEIERQYTREATDSLYNEVERHEAELRKLRGELAVMHCSRDDYRRWLHKAEDYIDSKEAIPLRGQWSLFWETRDALDAAEAREAVRQRNGRWFGVALGAAFLLGLYVGIIAGLA